MADALLLLIVAIITFKLIVFLFELFLFIIPFWIIDIFCRLLRILPKALCWLVVLSILSELFF